MKIIFKTEEEIALIRESSLLVAKTLAEIARHVMPGAIPEKLDSLAEEFIRDHGAVPAFKGYKGFPATLCFSPNEGVVHGIPGNTPLRDGDIVSVDCGVLKSGFYGDSAYTYEVGEVDEKVKKLLRVTRECLEKAVQVAVAGNRTGDIGHTVQQHAEANGFSVVRELVGHGLGRSLHEPPEVPNYGRRGSGQKMQEGLVIAIEPMINMGRKEVRQMRDGWTIITSDGKPSAHYEHTVAVRSNRADILTTFEYIERVLNNGEQKAIKQ